MARRAKFMDPKVYKKKMNRLSIMRTLLLGMTGSLIGLSIINAILGEEWRGSALALAIIVPFVFWVMLTENRLMKKFYYD